MSRPEFNTTVVYNTIASDYDACFYTPSAHLDEFLKRITPGGKILDAGCGCGTDAKYMHSHGFDITGVDNAENMLAIARQKFPGGRLRMQDMKNLGFADDSFDGLLASYSLTYIPKADVPSVLAKFYRILKSDGILCVGLLAGCSAETTLPEPFCPTLNLDLNVMSMGEIQDLLHNAGFRVIQSFLETDQNDAESLPYDKLCILTQKQ
ncbi:class I SAM-dependent methyltransferase [bacterium]|nr:class I SAM-dependent methyltransferase [bacterium]